MPGALPALNSISETWINLLWSQRRVHWEISTRIDDMLIAQLTSETAVTERKT
ncbi:uncharacterized protein METZ01_LOCUS249186 [marine metagenome]|uniref:Uncharacterized protein n=1 Tax=marine metagenome TaxID=408172 RepID=A0A382IAP9_9ZZZZ